MSRRIIFLALFALGMGGAAFAAQEPKMTAPPLKEETAPKSVETGQRNSCISCHRLNSDPRLNAPAKKFEKDIHAQKELSCISCHGGDSKSFDMRIAKASFNNFIGKPKPQDIPMLCNKCHGSLDYMRRFNPAMPVDQLKAYRTSVHGKLLEQGDLNVATCASCHNAHGILPAKHAASSVYPPNVGKTCAKCHSDKDYMEPYKVHTDQLEKYEKSVHGQLLLVKRDLSAPTCNDCHGNHGAFPPKVDSVSDMCGQCHINNRNLFVKSPHKKAFAEKNIPECVACHSNHNVKKVSHEMIGGKKGSVCIECHEGASKGLKVAVDMRQKIDDLITGIAQANEQLNFAEHSGMEVSEAKFEMKDADTALIMARTQTHTASLKDLEKVTSKGMKVVESGLKAAQAAMEEFHDRRKWVVLPIVLTLLLGGALFFKLREVEKAETTKKKDD